MQGGWNYLWVVSNGRALTLSADVPSYLHANTRPALGLLGKEWHKALLEGKDVS
jgi:hypothetical protein